MRRFFDRYKEIIVWIMVLSFFLGAGAFTAFRYMQPSSDSSSSETQQIAITVNGNNITSSEFDNAYQTTLQRQEQLYSQFNQDFSQLLQGAGGSLYKLRIKAQISDTLIKEELLKQEAEKRNIHPGSKDVEQKFNEQLNSLLSQRDWTKQELEQVLKQQGLTFKEFEKNWKESIKLDLQKQQLKDQIVGKIEPTDSDLKTYLEENRDSYVQTPVQVKASHIVVETQTESREILTKINGGEVTFDQVAEKMMDNPDMGWFTKDEKDNRISEVAFDLNQGEISNPIKTDAGWEIIQVKEHKQATVPPFEEIREKLKQDYISSEREEKFSRWYEQLKEQAQIEIKLPLVRAMVAKQDNLDKGLDEFRQIYNRGTSDDPYLPYYIGRIYEEKMNNAQQDLSQLTSSDESPESQSNKQQLQQQIKEFREKAVSNYMEFITNQNQSDTDVLQRVLQLDSSIAEANYYLAQIYGQQKKYTQALNLYREAIDNNPQYIAAYVGYGDLLRELQNFEKAVEQYKKALELDQNNSTLRNRLAETYFQMGKLDLARNNFEKVLQISSGNFSALNGMGNLLFKQEKYEQAIEYFNEALSIRSDVDTKLKLGQAYLNNGQIENAKLEFNSIISTHPYNAEAYLGLGDVYNAQEMDQRALNNYKEGLSRTRDESLRIKIAKKIVRIDPRDYKTRFSLAEAYSNQHVYDSAIEQYKGIIELDPGTDSLRNAYLGLADCYIKKTEYKTAKQYLQRGLQHAQRDVEKTSFYERIITTEEQSLGKEKLSTDGLDALLELAKIYLDQGRSDEAKTKLQRIQKIDPQFKKQQVDRLLSQIEG